MALILAALTFQVTTFSVPQCARRRDVMNVDNGNFDIANRIRPRIC